MQAGYRERYPEEVAAGVQRWRDAHPGYRRKVAIEARRRERRRVKRIAYGHEWRREHPTYWTDRRRAAGIRPRRRRVVRPRLELVEPLFPDLHHGAVLSFWDTELAMDLRQEEALAALEGRDPGEAVRSYRAREVGWVRRLRPLEEVA